MPALDGGEAELEAEAVFPNVTGSLGVKFAKIDGDGAVDALAFTPSFAGVLKKDFVGGGAAGVVEVKEVGALGGVKFAKREVDGASFSDSDLAGEGVRGVAASDPAKENWGVAEGEVLKAEANLDPPKRDATGLSSLVSLSSFSPSFLGSTWRIGLPASST